MKVYGLSIHTPLNDMLILFFIVRQIREMESIVPVLQMQRTTLSAVSQNVILLDLHILVADVDHHRIHETQPDEMTTEVEFLVTVFTSPNQS